MLAGAELPPIDRLARLIERFNHALVVDKRPPAVIFADEPDLEPLRAEMSIEGDSVFGRHYSFFQQLADQNLPEAWTRCAPRTRVLALWGEAEFVSTSEDHEWIAALVNRVADRDDQASFAVVEDSTHGFDRADTQADAMQQMQTPGAAVEFNPAIVETLTPWLNTISTPTAL